MREGLTSAGATDKPVLGPNARCSGGIAHQELGRTMTSPLPDAPELAALHGAIRQALQEAADPAVAASSRRFNKNADFACYGVSVPAFRPIARSFRPAFRALSVDQRLALALRLAASGISEEANVAVSLLALSVGELTPGCFGRLDGIIGQFHDWGATDGFALYVIQPLLLRFPDQTLGLLRAWNRSTSRWKRRASVVSFTRQVGQSGRFTDVALELCESLADDADDLVQKAVGWCLKDNLRGDAERVLGYILDLRRRGAPATVTLYALRDLKGPERAAALAVRSAKRKRHGGKLAAGLVDRPAA